MKNMLINENGRSMIEMLGVLAIMAVLPVFQKQWNHIKPIKVLTKFLP